MYSISTQAAVVFAIGGNLVLAAIFLYLWRMDRPERALGLWAAAYLASACRLVFRLASADLYPSAIYGEALLGSAAVVLLWMGTREFAGSAGSNPWRAGLAAICGFGLVAGLAAAGAIPHVIPYLVAGAVYFLAGVVLLRRKRNHPGVGYGLAGILLALYGGYVAVFSELAGPTAYIVGPVINLAIGLLLLAIAQRKQQFAATRLTEALQREVAERRAAETKGRESEQRFRAVLDTTRSLVGLLSPDGTVLDINRAALDHLAVEPSAVIGKPFWEISWWTHDPEQQRRLREAIRRVAAGGRDCFESAHPFPDGSIGYFNFFLTPIRDASGEVAYLVPEGHDITDRKRVEQTLHVAEQRFRAISEGSILGVFATEPAGQVTYMSRRAAEITGVSEAEARAGRWAERVHPGDRERMRAQWREAVAGQKAFAGERRYVRRDGGIVWTRLNVAPLRDGDDLRGFVGTIEDITERKRIEQAQRDSEEKFSSFFSLSPEAIAVGLFPGGEYAEVNDAWCQMFGYQREHVVGRTGLDLGVWESADDRRVVYEQLTQHGELRDVEMRFRRQDGQIFSAMTSVKVIEFGDNRRILWNVHDLTAQHRLEAQHSADEQALRASEDRLSRVFYLLPDLVTISSLDEGRFVDMNPQWEPVMGYTRDEALGVPAAQLGTWVDVRERNRLVEDVLRDGVVRGREIALRRKNGEILIAETSGSMFDWHGKKLLLLVTRDITAKRRAEDALRVSQEMFAKAFFNGPDYITLSRLSDGRLIEANEAFERFTGYSRGEAIGRTTAELGIWVNLEAREQWVDSLAKRGFVRDFEAILAHRDGQWRIALVNSATLEIDHEQCVIAVVREITEQRRIELALRESEEKFSTLFHQLPVAIAVTTREDGRYIDVNEAWLRQFGYARDEVIGKTGADLKFWVDPAVRAKLAEYLAERPDFLRWEIEFRARDGHIVPTECSGRIFELAEEEAVIWSAPDITERRRTQEEIKDLNIRLEARVRERTASLEQANIELAAAVEALKLAQDELVHSEKLAALGSLVAGVAHELNTPIGNSVTVASTLLDSTREFAKLAEAGKLRRSALDGFLGEARESAELLMRSLTQANELVSGFKQVAVDQTSAQRRRFDLKLVLEEVLATLAPMLKRTPFKLEADLADNIAMDSFPGPLGQIVTNLVTNSLTHGLEGRKHGEMRLVALQRGPQLIEISFVDDGVGIPQADVKRIFDPFFTTKLGRGGSGLGLNIVYNLVTRVLGGKIQVRSQPGTGTRFDILIPVCAPKADDREHRS